MKICSDVDGVILDYLQGFIDFTRREKISFSHDPEIWGVIRNFPNNEEVADQFLRGDDLRKLNYFDDSLQILNKLATHHELHIVTALEPMRCFCPERDEGPDPCEAHWRHCSLHSLLRFDRHVDAKGPYNCVGCVTRSLNPEAFLLRQM